MSSYESSAATLINTGHDGAPRSIGHGAPVPYALPGTGAPFNGIWALSLSFARAHFILNATQRNRHTNGRLVAKGLCHFPGMVDAAGIKDAASARRCSQCESILVGAQATDLHSGGEPA